MTTATATPASGAGAVLVSQLADDERHTATELIEILAHCRSITASADYRMLQAASLIHQEREEDYLCAVAGVDTGQASSITDLLDRTMATRLGCGPRADVGPNGLERATAEVGAVLNIPAARARELIIAGSDLRHRLPLTGHALAVGRIDLPTFLVAVTRTRLCTPEAITDVDAHIAQAVFARPPMARTRFTVMIDAIIADLDPDALLRRRERAATDRTVTIRPDRHSPGQSRVSASLPNESAAELNARLDAMAKEPHRSDPRTTAQRRADAILALTRGEQHLTCLCHDCTVAPDDLGDDEPATTSAPSEQTHTEQTEAEPTAPEPDAAPELGPDRASECRCDTRVRPTFHIVVNLSTLLGLDNAPGFLDGHGIIDADTMRSLLTHAERDFIRPQPPAPDATGYRPSKRLQALIRAGELCCTFPGCNAPAWHGDIDHTHPYNHRSPTTGGTTTRRNLKPLCRFHHRIKTFTAWRDHHDPMGTVFFQSPTGHTYLGNAYTGTDLFTALRPSTAGPPSTGSPSTPEHPARRHLDTLRTRQRDAHKHMLHDAKEAQPPPPF